MTLLADLPAAFLVLTVLVAGAAVWWAGARLSAYADEIADRTGLGHVAIGVLLLGAATSLPEISTSVVATLSGEVRMAVNNLLGGTAFQIVVLAITDLVVGYAALTVMVPGPRVMLNAVVFVMLMTITIIGATLGDVAIGVTWVGIFPLIVAGIYGLAIWLMGKEGATTGWKPAQTFVKPEEEERADYLPTARLVTATLGCAMIILIAGTVLTLAAEDISRRSGIDTGILGMTFLAAATSLPELSTALAAARIGRAELAIGDVLGGNMFDVVLLVVVDLIHREQLALREVDRASIMIGLIAILLTMIYLAGLIERRDKALLRMGYDSLAVIVVYVLGIAGIAYDIVG